MPQQCWSDAAEFATCKHGCKIIQADWYSLSRHYRKIHKEGNQNPPALIHNDVVRQRVAAGEVFEWGSARGTYEKELATLTKLRKLKRPKRSGQQPTRANASSANSVILAGSETTQVQSEVTLASCLDASASATAVVNQNPLNGNDQQGEQPVRQESGQSDPEIMPDAPPVLEQINEEDTIMTEPAPEQSATFSEVLNQITEYDLVDYSDDEEMLPTPASAAKLPPPKQIKPPELMNLPTEVRQLIIGELVAREKRFSYGFDDLKAERFSTALLGTNHALREETLDYLSKEVIVIKLDLHTRDLHKMETIIGKIAKLPLVYVCPLLVDNKTLPQRAATLNIDVHVESSTPTHVSQDGYAAFMRPVVSYSFIYEARPFRSLVKILLESTIFEHTIRGFGNPQRNTIQYVGLVFSKQAMKSRQERQAETLLRMMSTLRNVKSAEIINCPESLAATIAAVPTWMQRSMGEVPAWGMGRFAVWGRLQYAYELFDGAQLLAAGSDTLGETLNELLIAREEIEEAIIRAEAVAGTFTYDLKIIYFVKDALNVAIQKILSRMLADAYTYDKLASVPAALIVHVGMPSLELTSQHSERFRAMFHFVTAVGQLWRLEHYMKLHGSLPPDAQEQVVNATKHLYIACHLLGGTSQRCNRLFDEYEPRCGEYINHRNSAWGYVAKLIHPGTWQEGTRPVHVWQSLEPNAYTTCPDPDRRWVWKGEQSMVQWGYGLPKVSGPPALPGFRHTYTLEDQVSAEHPGPMVAFSKQVEDMVGCESVGLSERLREYQEREEERERLREKEKAQEYPQQYEENQKYRQQQLEFMESIRAAEAAAARR